MKKLLQREKGQSLVIIVFAFIVLLVAVGLAVDGGTLLLHRRRMQNAADAAAMAAARGTACWTQSFYAKCDPTEATYSVNEGDVLEWANIFAQENDVRDTNDDPEDHINDNVEVYYVDIYGDRLSSTPLDNSAASAAVCTSSPCAWTGVGECCGIEVTTYTTFRTAFLSLIGQQELPAQATATAVFQIAPPGGDYAIWAAAKPGECNGATLALNPSSATFNGNLHANDKFSIGGSGSSVTGSIEYVSDCHQCDPSDGKITTTSGVVGTAPSDRYLYSLQDYQCGDPSNCNTCGGIDLPGQRWGAKAACNDGNYYYINGDIAEGDVTADGLYYITGDAKFNGLINNRITVVAEGDIDVSGQGAENDLLYYTDGLLFFSNNQGSNQCTVAVVKVAADDAVWSGVIYAPRGRCEMSLANNSTHNGALVCHTVQLSGSDMSIAYQSDDIPPKLTRIALIR